MDWLGNIFSWVSSNFSDISNWLSLGMKAYGMYSQSQAVDKMQDQASRYQAAERGPSTYRAFGEEGPAALGPYMPPGVGQPFMERPAPPLGTGLLAEEYMMQQGRPTPSAAEIASFKGGQYGPAKEEIMGLAPTVATDIVNAMGGRGVYHGGREGVAAEGMAKWLQQGMVPLISQEAKDKATSLELAETLAQKRDASKALILDALQKGEINYKKAMMDMEKSEYDYRRSMSKLSVESQQRGPMAGWSPKPWSYQARGQTKGGTLSALGGLDQLTGLIGGGLEGIRGWFDTDDGFDRMDYGYGPGYGYDPWSKFDEDWKYADPENWGIPT